MLVIAKDLHFSEKLYGELYGEENISSPSLKVLHK